MFSYEICKIFKDTYFEEHLQTAASIRSGVFIVNSEDIFTPFPNISIVNSERANVCWVWSEKSIYGKKLHISPRFIYWNYVYVKGKTNLFSI